MQTACLGTKSQVWKTVPGVEIFENDRFLLSCIKTKTEVFEYNDVIHHIAHNL